MSKTHRLKLINDMSGRLYEALDIPEARVAYLSTVLGTISGKPLLEAIKYFDENIGTDEREWVVVLVTLANINSDQIKLNTYGGIKNDVDDDKYLALMYKKRILLEPGISYLDAGDDSIIFSFVNNNIEYEISIAGKVLIVREISNNVDKVILDTTKIADDDTINHVMNLVKEYHSKYESC